MFGKLCKMWVYACDLYVCLFAFKFANKKEKKKKTFQNK